MNTITPSGQAAKHFTTVVVAFVLLLLHNLDEAFWHPEGDGKTALVGVGLIAVITIAVYRRLGKGLRVALLAILGLLAVVAATGGHLAHFVTGTVVPLDYTGILFFLGGCLLLYVAYADATDR